MPARGFAPFRPRHAALLAALTVSARAAADPPAEPPAAPMEHDLPGPIPPAKDKLGGHWMLRAGPLFSVPFGALDRERALDRARDFNDTAGLGLGVSADLGVGVSRSVVFGGWFEYATFGEADPCGCDASSIAFGPFARYHLVQGMRFDPWLSLGVGYRRIRASGPDFTYAGVDGRLELGGDWYALSQLAFGPYAGLSLGTLLERPAATKAALYGSFSAGLRVAFDLQGR